LPQSRAAAIVIIALWMITAIVVGAFAMRYFDTE